MFHTEIASLACEKIYDLLEIDENITKMFMLSQKEKENLLSALREPSYTAEEQTMGFRETIEDVIVGWVSAVIEKDGGHLHDAKLLDENNRHILSQRGIIDRAIENVTERGFVRMRE